MSTRARHKAERRAWDHGIEIVRARQYGSSCPRIGAGWYIYVGRRYTAADIRWGVDAILYRERVAARRELHEAHAECVRLQALGMPVPAEAERRLGRAVIAASDRDWAAMKSNDLDGEGTKQ